MRNLMLKAAAWGQARGPREEGQTVIEYALIVAVVSIALITLMGTFGVSLVNYAVSKVASFAPAT